MLKKLSCPSCGVNLKPDAYYCDYCGAFFEKTQNNLEKEQLKRFESKNQAPKSDAQTLDEISEEDLYALDTFVSTEEIEGSRLNSILISYNNIKEGKPFFAVVIILIFSLIFLSGIVIELPFVSIITIIIISGTINGQKEKKQQLIRLYEKGAYKKAYQKLNEAALAQININIIKQKILLCYYRLDKKDEAKTLIQKLSLLPQTKDEHIKEVAQKLGVIYEPKSKFSV